MPEQIVGKLISNSMNSQKDVPISLDKSKRSQDKERVVIGIRALLHKELPLEQATRVANKISDLIYLEL